MRKSINLTIIVLFLRLVALSSLALWCVPTFRHESTATTDHKFHALGWPTHWFETELTRESLGGPLRRDKEVGGARPPGAERPKTFDEGRDRYNGHYLRTRRVVNPLLGPVWQTLVGVVVWMVATYVNQLSRFSVCVGEPGK